ncbi:hypothetical protein [Dactylosporangium sp. NPDC000521]|uniref:hypothetical protein n=1 Tax=Dactylosporangium sp. NPDC000521 TaxID=3363975 RepID=UPI0036CF2C11
MEFAETWGRKYPAIVKLWSGAWARFVPFLAFDVDSTGAGRSRWSAGAGEDRRRKPSRQR